MLNIDFNDHRIRERPFCIPFFDWNKDWRSNAIVNIAFTVTLEAFVNKLRKLIAVTRFNSNTGANNFLGLVTTCLAFHFISNTKVYCSVGPFIKATTSKFQRLVHKFVNAVIFRAVGTSSKKFKFMGWFDQVFGTSLPEGKNVALIIILAFKFRGKGSWSLVRDIGSR